MSARTLSPKAFDQEDQRNGDDADGHVDPEDALPVPALDHGAADQRTGRDAEAGDAAPDADGERTTLRLDRAGEQRERERHDARAAESLDGAGDDELRRVGGERGECRGEREDRDADDEDRSTAEAVTERDGEEDEAGEDQRVCVDEPLQLLDGGAEVLVEHGERVRHHEVVEGGHEHRNAGGEQNERERDAPRRGGGSRHLGAP